MEEMKNSSSNFPELEAAFLATTQRKELINRYIEAMKPKKKKNPRDYDGEPDKKAVQYWRWAFEKVKSIRKEAKR